MITSALLAGLNAALNSTAFLLMGFGYFAIKRGERERHRKLMLGAFTASCVFLVSYLTRIVLFGDTRFTGTGIARTLYFVLLASHVLLAMVSAPLVTTTLVAGLRDRLEGHRKLAKVALPIWAYVSITGVMVYLVLYRL